jgi:hypothetical protein
VLPGFPKNLFAYGELEPLVRAVGDDPPRPFGTFTNRSQNFANRAAPVDCGRNGNTVGSTAALGPAFMGGSRYAN